MLAADRSEGSAFVFSIACDNTYDNITFAFNEVPAA